jgi:membrane dipeptidase
MVAGQPLQVPIVFDALGEIRTIYTMDLVDQILASGTRAISITLTDPKVTPTNAFDLMM